MMGPVTGLGSKAIGVVGTKTVLEFTSLVERGAAKLQYGV